MKKILSLVTGLSVVVCGSAFLAACDDKEETPPAPPAPEATFTVKTDALTMANEEVKTIFEKVYNQTTGKRQSYDAFKEELSALNNTDYYVTVGVAANMGDVNSITVNNLTYSASDTFLFSVGNNSFIENEVFDYESGTLRIAAPVVAFELRVSNPTNKIKLNDKEFDFKFDAGTIGSFDWSKVEFGAGSKNSATRVGEEGNEYNIVLKDSKSALIATPEEGLTGGYYLTRDKVGGELRQYGITGTDEGGFGGYFGWSDDGSVDAKFHGQTRVQDIQYVTDTEVKASNLTLHLSVENDEEFKSLIENAQESTVTLEKDYVLTNQVEITKELTIDLNGHTISAEKGSAAVNYRLFSVGANGKLTVVDNSEQHTGRIVSKDQKIFTLWDASSQLFIKGGNFETGNCEVVYVNVGTAEITGGTFKSTDTKYNKDGKNFTLNCLNENTITKAEKKASIIVLGGEFYNFNPGVLQNDDHGRYVPMGWGTTSKTEDGGEWYYLTPASEVAIHREEFLLETIKYAQNGTVIKLDDTLTLTDRVLIPEGKSLILDLNGQSISANGSFSSYSSVFVVMGQLTVRGEGTIKTDKKIFSVNNEKLSLDEAALTIEGGTYETSHCEVVYDWAGRVDIKGGSFKSTDTTHNKEGKDFTLNCKDEQVAAGKVKIVVTGGEFYNFNPSAVTSDTTTSYLPETGYQSVEDTTSHEEETWHVVSPKED